MNEDKMDVTEILNRFKALSAEIVKDLEGMEIKQANGKVNWTSLRRTRVNLRLIEKDVYQPFRKASHAVRDAYETFVK